MGRISPFRSIPFQVLVTTVLTITYHKCRNFRGHNILWVKFRGDKFSWVSLAHHNYVITVANSSCVQIFVGLVFVGVAAHEN